MNLRRSKKQAPSQIQSPSAAEAQQFALNQVMQMYTHPQQRIKYTATPPRKQVWMSAASAYSVVRPMVHTFSASHFETEKDLDLELSFSEKPIMAWRVWAIYAFQMRGGTTQPRLGSVGIGTILWPPGERMEAHCAGGWLHEAPWAGCDCGMWSLKKKNDAMVMAGAPNYIFGEVALWGRVLECKLGWRAQFAYPQKLYAFKRLNEEVRTQLSTLYRIPVVSAGNHNPGRFMQFETIHPDMDEVHSLYSCGHRIVTTMTQMRAQGGIAPAICPTCDEG